MDDSPFFPEKLGTPFYIVYYSSAVVEGFKLKDFPLDFVTSLSLTSHLRKKGTATFLGKRLLVNVVLCCNICVCLMGEKPLYVETETAVDKGLKPH